MSLTGSIRLEVNDSCEHIKNFVEEEKEVLDWAKNVAAAARIFILASGNWYQPNWTGSMEIPTNDFHDAIEVITGKEDLADNQLVWLTVQKMRNSDDWTVDIDKRLEEIGGVKREEKKDNNN